MSETQSISSNNRKTKTILTIKTSSPDKNLIINTNALLTNPFMSNSPPNNVSKYKSQEKEMQPHNNLKVTGRCGSKRTFSSKPNKKLYIYDATTHINQNFPKNMNNINVITNIDQQKENDRKVFRTSVTGSNYNNENEVNSNNNDNAVNNYHKILSDKNIYINQLQKELDYYKNIIQNSGGNHGGVIASNSPEGRGTSKNSPDSHMNSNLLFNQRNRSNLGNNNNNPASSKNNAFSLPKKKPYKENSGLLNQFINEHKGEVDSNYGKNKKYGGKTEIKLKEFISAKNSNGNNNNNNNQNSNNNPVHIKNQLNILNFNSSLKNNGSNNNNELNDKSSNNNINDSLGSDSNNNNNKYKLRVGMYSKDNSSSNDYNPLKHFKSNKNRNNIFQINNISNNNNGSESGNTNSNANTNTNSRLTNFFFNSGDEEKMKNNYSNNAKKFYHCASIFEPNSNEPSGSGFLGGGDGKCNIRKLNIKCDSPISCKDNKSSKNNMKKNPSYRINNNTSYIRQDTHDFIDANEIASSSNDFDYFQEGLNDIQKRMCSLVDSLFLIIKNQKMAKKV